MQDYVLFWNFWWIRRVGLEVSQHRKDVNSDSFMWRVMWLQSFHISHLSHLLHVWDNLTSASVFETDKVNLYMDCWCMACSIYGVDQCFTPETVFHFHLSKGMWYSTDHLLDFIVKVQTICFMTTSSKWYFPLPCICCLINHVHAF